MKSLLYISMMFVGCQGNSQVDLNQLSAGQWLQDLEYLTDKVEKKYAGFTPDLKIRFKEEADKLRTALPSLSVNQRIMECARLMAMLNDGHTEISLDGAEANFNRLPIILYYFGNDLRIVAANHIHISLLGSRVLKIEDHSVMDILEKLKPYMNCDNEVEYITTAPTLMIMPEVLEEIGVAKNTAGVTITVANDQGAESKVELQPITRDEYSRLQFSRVYNKAPYYMENLSSGYWFKYLPESKTMYLNIVTLFNQDGSKPLKKVLEEMLEALDRERAEKLVIDLRRCRGGNYNNILPTIEAIAKRTSINQKGKLYVVNGRLTFSAASVATIYFKEKTQAIIVGEVSRARPNWADNMESYTLPNSKIEFDCLEKLKIHSRVLGNSRIIPVDVEIPRSFEHYRNGRDEVMEYILSVKK